MAKEQYESVQITIKNMTEQKTGCVGKAIGGGKLKPIYVSRETQRCFTNTVFKIPRSRTYGMIWYWTVMAHFRCACDGTTMKPINFCTGMINPMKRFSESKSRARGYFAELFCIFDGNCQPNQTKPSPPNKLLGSPVMQSQRIAWSRDGRIFNIYSRTAEKLKRFGMKDTPINIRTALWTRWVK